MVDRVGIADHLEGLHRAAAHLGVLVSERNTDKRLSCPDIA